MKIAIATPMYNGTATVQYINSLTLTLKVLTLAKIEWEYFTESGDTFIDRARNALCARFMNSDCTDLIFIDADMGWDIEGFYQLLQSPYGVTAGVGHFKNEDPDSWATVIKTHEDRTPVCDAKHGLIEADFVGGAFLRIKKEIFSNILSKTNLEGQCYYNEKGEVIHNYFECKIKNALRYGEDVVFCEKVRESGEKIWIEPRINLIHVGQKEYIGNYHKYLIELKQKEDPRSIKEIIKDLNTLHTISKSSIAQLEKLV
jgi:hypothetical protein